MFSFIIFAAMMVHISGHTRIIGGQYASPGQFPHQVSLQLNGNHYCGGSIISSNFVITAAHCTIGQNPSQVKVLMGTTDLLARNSKIVNIASFIRHPQYNPLTQDFDVSLIKLSASLPLGSPTIDKIKMVSADDVFAAGTVATVSGFGVTNILLQPSTRLKYVHVPLLDFLTCKMFFPLTSNMICAGELHGQESSCQGDSGGPLTVQNKLLGIVSFGFGCGKPGPAVYAHVGALRSWIKQESGV